MDGLGDNLIPVWSLYYRQGYDEGYRRAVADLTRSLLELSEQYVSQRPSESAAELRRVLHPFEEFLERKVHQMSPDDGPWMEGGAGI
jgi:hypothetical protein